MTEKDIRGKLIEIISRIGEYNNAILEGKNFFSEKVFDSMQAIDYMIYLEEEFGIEMNMEIMENKRLGKISDMTEYIFSNQK